MVLHRQTFLFFLAFESQAVFHSYYLIVCYALPLVILAITYTLIFRDLSTSQVCLDIGYTFINPFYTRQSLQIWIILPI